MAFWVNKNPNCCALQCLNMKSAEQSILSISAPITCNHTWQSSGIHLIPMDCVVDLYPICEAYHLALPVVVLPIMSLHYFASKCILQHAICMECQAMKFCLNYVISLLLSIWLNKRACIWWINALWKKPLPGLDGQKVGGGFFRVQQQVVVMDGLVKLHLCGSLLSIHTYMRVSAFIGS